ncbi:MAG: hypothetical protein AWU58_2052 [Methanohalophilus sp. T328-1]|uniref:Transcriptional regulator n=2 Tax=Methanohalophilus TaxID=2175 RepID=A0A285FTM7_9EURY|nr:MAG: hypothetical protein AWU58_2052 [Methanohalophilus sp. T328-1]ODV49828.1 MAG: hypothetical protein A8273_880 [Methanohalophilus sp. 2-GBenrich]RSD34397.1 MAG: hypothetical protein CI952_1284 [Methanohalophilus sp.]TCL11424.1 hypothetical protein C7960_0575 [Methanohalophilus euhalobius]RSD35174.1 MAG: hypothetical protein CI953_321 [Methanohalophilus sp.]
MQSNHILPGDSFMKEQPRTENRARFAVQYTDEDFTEAVEEALEKATVSASDVAEIVGCNPRYAKDRLLKLAEEGKLEAEMKGKGWGFRLARD